MDKLGSENTQRNPRSNCQHSLDHGESKRIPEKHVLSTFLTMLKPLGLCGSQQTWKILKEMGVPDHLTCLLRNLYASQEATVRTRHGTNDWFKIREYDNAVYCHSAHLITCRVHCAKCQAGWVISWNQRLPREIINNLRHTDVATLMAESEEELKSLLMRVKEEGEKAGLKLNIQKTKIMASCPITSWQIGVETVADFIFLSSKITADSGCSHEIKRCLLLRRTAVTNLDTILKSRDVTLPTKVHIVKALVLPVVKYGCKSWTIKKAECWRIDAFELWCWRRLLRVPWTARRSKQSILKEISPEYSLEGLMLKRQCFGHLMQRTNLLEKPLILGQIEGQMRRGGRGWDG